MDFNNSVTLKLFKDQNSQTVRVNNIVGSCNGIICVLEKQRGLPSLYISNPITRESLPLPIHPVHKQIGFTRLWGFGYCPMRDVYKVVLIQIANDWSKKPEVTVMTIGSGIWRGIGNYAYHFADQPYGVYLNGFLHWVGYSGESPDFICALDLECECFQQIPLPPGCCLSWTAPPSFELGVLKGRLSITVQMLNIMIVWVMRDYDVKKSWTPELRIIIRGLFFGSLSFPQVLNLTEEGEVLLLDKSDLHVFASRTKGFVRVEIDKVLWCVMQMSIFQA